MFWTNFYLFLTIFVLLFRQMIINWVGIYAVESSILSILWRIKREKEKEILACLVKLHFLCFRKRYMI